MAGVAFLKWRGLESTTKSYAKSVICATSASLRCIMRVSSFSISVLARFWHGTDAKRLTRKGIIEIEGRKVSLTKS